MASFENLSNVELRKRLLEYNIDLPTSVNKDFMIKKLQQVSPPGSGQATPTRPKTPSRQSTNSSNNSAQTTTTPTRSSTQRQLTPSRSSVSTDQRRWLPTPQSPPIVTQVQLDEQEEEESSPLNSSSNRFKSYYSYFKGDTRKSEPPLPGSPFSSSVGSPNSTYANAGSPYRNKSFTDESDEEDSEEEEGEIRDSRFVTLMNKVVSPMKGWFSPQKSTPNDQQQLTDGSSRYFGSPSSSSSPRSSSSTNNNSGRYSTNSQNGHPASSGLASRLYAPQVPSPAVAVPPAIAAGRQAGFKAFFSRGERNGYGYSSANGTTDWASSSHLISKILVFVFLMAFVALGGVYYYKSTISPSSIIDKGLTTTNTATFTATGSNIKLPPPPPPVKKIVATSMIYPICGMTGVDPHACVPKDQIRNSKILFTALKEELKDRAGWKGCPSGDVQHQITLQSAKTLLYRLVTLRKAEVDGAFEGMLMLVTENPSCGLKIEPKGIPADDDDDDYWMSTKEVKTLDHSSASISAVGFPPHFTCTLWSGLYTILYFLILLAISGVVGYGGYKWVIHFRGRKAREEHEMFNLVEKILNLLNDHYEESKNSGGDQYLAVNHIRDELLSPRDRKKKEALWNKVVGHISTNESRVREEVQHISGEEFRVWRWLPSASPLVSKRYSVPPNSTVASLRAQAAAKSRQSLPAKSLTKAPTAPISSPAGLYPNLGGLDLDNGDTNNSLSFSNKWQGQAFEMFDGSPNSLLLTPTTCLKIRQMFDAEKDPKEFGENWIEKEIIEKCANSKILHIGIDLDSQCVYVRCQTKMDARNAYSALHGWWFESHLLSVKFLREDRYFSRFPEAKYRTAPLSVNSSVKPLSGEQHFSNSMNIRSGIGASGSGDDDGSSSSARVRHRIDFQ